MECPRTPAHAGAKAYGKKGLDAYIRSIKRKKRINTKYGLDIHYYRSAAAGGGVALL